MLGIQLLDVVKSILVLGDDHAIVLHTEALAAHDAALNNFSTILDEIVVLLSTVQANGRVTGKVVHRLRVVLKLHLCRLAVALALDNQDLIGEPSAGKALIREVLEQISRFPRVDSGAVGHLLLLTVLSHVGGVS